MGWDDDGDGEGDGNGDSDSDGDGDSDGDSDGDGDSNSDGDSNDDGNGNRKTKPQRFQMGICGNRSSKKPSGWQGRVNGNRVVAQWLRQATSTTQSLQHG